MNGLPIFEFDELDLDGAQVEKGSPPPVAGRFSVISRIRVIHLSNFKRSEAERLFIVLDRVLDALDNDPNLTKAGGLKNFILSFRFLFVHHILPLSRPGEILIR